MTILLNPIRLFLLGYMLFLSAPVSTQVQDVTQDGVSVQIPFQKYGDFILVQGKLFGTAKLNLIFDTGAENTIIFERLYTDLFGVEYDRRIPLYGADLSVELYALIVRNIELKVGPAKPKTMSMLVLEEDYSTMNQFLGVEIHGILGASYFSDYVVEINYRSGYIELHKAEKFNYRERKYDTFPISLANNKPYVEANVILADSDSLALNFLLDTGAGLALLIHTNTHPSLELPDKVIRGQLGAGLGGYLRGYLGRLQAMELWGYQFQGIVACYQDLDTFLFDYKQLNRQGIIGNQFLSRFHLYIDYPRAKVHIRPYRKYNRPFKYDKSGLSIIATGPYLREYYVINVVEDSPAFEAGIRKGDRLLTFQRLPAKWFGLGTINRKLMKREGKKIRMKIERNSQAEIFSFQLRELF
nr:aspartyl protease family protein [Saprospiraceae bacterium]